MRKLYDIITDVKDGKMPSYEECYYALLAYEAMFIIDHNTLLRACTNDKPNAQFVRNLQAKNSYEMYKKALDKSPKEWLGPNHDPANPEYQKMRQIGQKILDKFMSKEGDN